MLNLHTATLEEFKAIKSGDKVKIRRKGLMTAFVVEDFNKDRFEWSIYFTHSKDMGPKRGSHGFRHIRFTSRRAVGTREEFFEAISTKQFTVD